VSSNELKREVTSWRISITPTLYYRKVGVIEIFSEICFREGVKSLEIVS
jgi:hypothetical protein